MILAPPPEFGCLISNIVFWVLTGTLPVLLINDLLKRCWKVK